MTRPQLTHHILAAPDPFDIADFYCRHFGMVGIPSLAARRCFVGTPRASAPPELLPADLGNPHSAILEFVLTDAEAELAGPVAQRSGSNLSSRYWKIGVTVPDVDAFRAGLVAAGVDVAVAAQFLDIGYLCHLRDPAGFAIELLQYRFAPLSGAAVDLSAHGGPLLAHITLRVVDAERSIAFYRDVLGMRVLSRQRVEPHRFTLHFLACTDDTPPVDDLESVENREWLWQRPYTCLELQEFWDGRPAPETEGLPGGFLGIGFTVPDLLGLLERVPETVAETPTFDPVLGAMVARVVDPDGNRIRLAERRGGLPKREAS